MLGFIHKRGETTRKEVLDRFHRDDEAQVCAVVHDLGGAEKARTPSDDGQCVQSREQRRGKGERPPQPAEQKE